MAHPGWQAVVEIPAMHLVHAQHKARA